MGRSQKPWMQLGRGACVLALALWVTPITVGQPPGDVPIEELLLETGAEEVTVSGLLPGSEVALLGVGRQWERTYTRVLRLDEVLVDADGDGVVSVVVPEGVPPLSVWVAVEVATGRSVAVGAEGFSFQEVAPEDRAIRGQGGALAVGRGQLDVLAVRPGVGAWVARGRKGAGSLEMPVERFRERGPGVGGSRALGRLRAGDVVVGIDPRSLDVLLWEVGR